MSEISVREAKAAFSAVCDRANAGEPVTITKNGQPWVMVVPIPEETIKRDFSRKPPLIQGAKPVDLEKFNTPMDDQELELWEGKESK